MINILSLQCSLAYAPYLVERAETFLSGGAVASGVIRQGGLGLVIRADDHLILRHQNRESALAAEEARHYLATLRFRAEFFDIVRTSDEVVLANTGASLMLSHPQSTVWLSAASVRSLAQSFAGEADETSGRLPEWLTVSASGGRLLISDQRSGRWALLGSDHRAEFERRAPALDAASDAPAPPPPPTFLLKGFDVHLQSMVRLARTLDDFAARGDFEGYEEVTPTYMLRVARSSDGLELVDPRLRVAVTQREARKWAAILRGELERLRVRQVERGRVSTLSARGDGGLWLMQWGDELFMPDDPAGGRPAEKRDGDFRLWLDEGGNCVALLAGEVDQLLA